MMNFKLNIFTLRNLRSEPVFERLRPWTRNYANQVAQQYLGNLKFMVKENSMLVFSDTGIVIKKYNQPGRIK